MKARQPGVTFLVPVHNGAEWLEEVLASIRAQADGRPMEILTVEDGSSDRSPEILARHSATGVVRIIQGPRRGATAALNEGLRHAKHAIICQVDQDVVLQPGWMRHLVEALDDPHVAAAQGYYVTPARATVWARVMGLDLENRYRRLSGRDIDHVCTGNTAYRASALREVGAFDESFGYGYDNDLSYRLVGAGYSLVIRPEARSLHRWRDGWWTYLVQQYGFGYGRLDLVAKHRRRLAGDVVSPTAMMLHAPLAAIACVAGVLAIVLAVVDRSPAIPAWVAVGIVTALTVERFVTGIRARVAFDDRAGLWFAPVHLARDVAWVAALAVWGARRLLGVTPHPSASMQPRPSGRSVSDAKARDRVAES